ncbi:hypothetical protein [Sulfurimonas sp.]|uniref:hypothetical protein n=1 Tax=Sulfurimonas sp. TaxID=2022749 RepID=UPI0019DF4F38|nr:hypothetical protein [Sulfurimonas sp.]MBE0514225.1 hypothetical protein [Sulfurimonas sp.]
MSKNFKNGFKARESLNLKNVKTVFKDMQKSYEGANKTRLVKYIQKEDNVFQSDKSIEKMNLKHFIISPIEPELYKKLTKEQKKQVQEVTKEWTHKTFNKWGYIAGIEDNENKSGLGVKEGFHVHAGVNDKYSIKGSIDLLRLREGLVRDLSEKLPISIRKKLGLKNKKERQQEKNESNSKKQKFNHLNKVKNSAEYQKEMSTIKDMTGQISNIFKVMNFHNEKKEELSEIHKLDKHHILKKQEPLKNEIEHYNKSIKKRDDDIEYIEKNISQKDERIGQVESYYNNEIKHLKYFLEDEESSLNFYADGQHSFFKKLMKDKKKDGQISTAEFLGQVARNKSYWKMIKDDKRKEHENYVKYKQEQMKSEIKGIEKDIKLFESDKNLLRRLKDSDNKSLNISRKEYKSTNEEMTNHLDIFNENINEITEKLKVFQQAKTEMSEKKKQSINKKKDMIEQALNYEDTQYHKKNHIVDGFADDISEKAKLKIRTASGEHKDGFHFNETNQEIHIPYRKNNQEIRGTVIFANLVRLVKEQTNLSKAEIIDMYDEKTLLRQLKEVMKEDRKINKVSIPNLRTLEEALAKCYNIEIEQENTYEYITKSEEEEDYSYMGM